MLKSSSKTWYEIADSHPAARTTIIHRHSSPDPRTAVGVALNHTVTLEPLNELMHDQFVLGGGWRGWRVTAPESLGGRWVYTRPVDEYAKRVESGIWPPRVWQDCVARYESRGLQSSTRRVTKHGNGNTSNGVYNLQASDKDWYGSLLRDQAITKAMIDAVGTENPLNPFCGIGHSISRNILKPTIVDLCSSYVPERPGTRIEPRSLRMLLTQIGIRRATESLVESHFVGHAELWLYEQAEAGAQRDETDQLERYLLKILRDRSFVWVVRCCAIAAMCGLDSKAAELWYKTGGDCSEHPDLRRYATHVREYLPVSLPQTEGASDPEKGFRSTVTPAVSSSVKRELLTYCGATTLTGAVCRHKISPTTKRCPAKHPNPDYVSSDPR